MDEEFSSTDAEYKVTLSISNQYTFLKSAVMDRGNPISKRSLT